MSFFFVLVLENFLPYVGSDNADNYNRPSKYLPLPPRFKEEHRGEPNKGANNDNDAY